MDFGSVSDGEPDQRGPMLPGSGVAALVANSRGVSPDGGSFALSTSSDSEDSSGDDDGDGVDGLGGGAASAHASTLTAGKSLSFVFMVMTVQTIPCPLSVAS